MVIYFYNKYTKYQLSPIIIKNLYFLEITATLFTIGTKSNQFFNTNFLFYSMLSFYTWMRYIVGKRLSLLFVIEDTDLSLVKLLFTLQNFNFISENSWIPGILSNSQEIWSGERYIQAVEEGIIKFKNKPDFLFLCSTKRPLVSHEANSQLIPQIVTLSSITNAMSNYFIPLFIPKLITKYKKKKIISTIFENIWHYRTQRIIFEKHLIITKSTKKINYLIYLSLLKLINY
jgi:hypothetical protein